MQYIKTYVASILVALFVIVLPTHVAAHAGNYDLKYVDGSNLILVTYNSHDPVSGITVEHNIRLYDLTGQPVPFDKVRVKTTQGKRVVSDRTVQMSNNEAKLSYRYPTQGNYDIQATFFDNDKQVSQGSMIASIRKGANQSFLATAFTLQTAAAFALGLIVTSAYFLRDRILNILVG